MKPTTTNFQKLIEKVKEDRPKIKERTMRSLDWYNKHIQKEFGKKTSSPFDVYDTQEKRLPSIAGQLLTFRYTPKQKLTLPLYDEFPLVLTLDIDRQSVLGLNFHYLKPMHRVLFMSELYKYLGQKNGEPVVRIDYKMLMEKPQLKYYKPCMRRYLLKNISQKISIIPVEDWELALFLPTAKFVSHVGESTLSENVWTNAAKLIDKE